jgi:ABC-2 type transport system permease protein
MRGFDLSRVGAVVRKELREYRRKRAIIVGMVILPCLFLVEPTVAIFFVAGSSSGVDQYVVFPLLYLLLIPVFTPPTLAAYSVAGEREQGTLEPLLTTPITKEEFILGKAAAVMLPTVALSYAIFGLFLVAVRLFASAAVATAVFQHGPILIGMLLLTPLLAAWAIWVGMAVSVRANEVRVAQQLGMLSGLPAVGLVLLVALGDIQPTFSFAVKFAIVLIAIDMAALRVVSRMLDRERLVTGSKAVRS